MNKDYFVIALFFTITVAASAAFAQTSEFTLQGKFPDAGGTASGNYQMEFRLFDAATAGNQIGTTILMASVPVTKNVFTVNLDFGVAAFPGADRFLEITTRKTFSEPYTLLGPRQKITSAPYSIKSKTSDTATTAGFAVSADTANVATRSFDSLKLGGLEPSRFVRYDSNDNVGIGTDSTGAKLAVAGTIESKSGGFKFPDATTQTTAGMMSVNTNGTLTGNGTSASPLGVSSPLMVRDLDHPAKQPFFFSGDADSNILNTPPGKIAVVEFVTIKFQKGGTTLDSADAALRIQPLDVTIIYLAPSYARVVDAPTPYMLIHFTHTVKLYLAFGQNLRIYCGNTFSSVMQCTGTVTGYFVDDPSL